MADVDEDIIRSLQADGRAQFSSIAAQIGVHRSVVAQRVHELLASGEIWVLAAVHPQVLGLPVQAHLMLRISGPTSPVFTRLLGMGNVVYLSEITGPFQAVVEIWAASRDDLARSVHAIQAIDGVIDLQFTLYERVLRTLLLADDPDLSGPRLDDFDIALMTQLQKDGRLAFDELARRTGRSASACRARVLRLLDARVMRIGAVRRRQSMSSAVLFGIGVIVHGGLEAQSAVEQSLLRIPGLEFAARTVGRYAVVAAVPARSVIEHTELVRGIRAHAGVHMVETWIHAAVWAERYEWTLDRLERLQDS